MAPSGSQRPVDFVAAVESPAEVGRLLEIDAAVAVAESGPGAAVAPLGAAVRRVRVWVADGLLALDLGRVGSAPAALIGPPIPIQLPVTCNRSNSVLSRSSPTGL